MQDIDKSITRRFLDVCAHLQKSNSVIVDDTLVEKLFDFIKYASRENKDFIDTICKEEDFVKLFKNNEDDGGSVVGMIFRLRVLGTFSVTGSDTADLLLWQQCLLADTMTTTLSSAYWQEASVRNAWFQSLSLLLEHSNGMMLIITKDFLSVAFECINDKSMFVAALSRQLIVKFLSRAYQSIIKEGGHAGMSKIFSLTYKRIMENILSMTQSDELAKRQSAMYIIGEISKVSALIVDDLVSKHNLLELLSLDDGADATSDVVTLISCVVNARSVCEPEIEVLLCRICHQIVKKGHIKNAIRLAGELATRMQEETNKEYMTSLLLMPISLALGKTEAADVNGENSGDVVSVKHEMERSVKKEMCSSNIRLLMQSLNTCIAILKRGEDIEITEHLLPLLEASIADSSWSHHNRFSKSLIGNATIQRCLLDLIELVYKGESTKGPMLKGIFKCLILLIRDPNIKATMFTKALHNLVQLIESSTRCHCDLLSVIFSVDGDESCAPSSELYLGEVLQRRLHHVQWEVRDSCLQFLHCILKNANGTEVITTWCLKFQFHTYIWQALSDVDSYVRACAMETLGQLSLCNALWEALLVNIGMNQIEVTSKIIGTLQNDTEAFARRAAVDLLSSWGLNDVTPSSVKTTIRKSLSTTIADLDWEVKLHTLKFWQNVIQNEFDSIKRKSRYALTVNKMNSNTENNHQVSYQSAFLDDLCALGVFEVLHSGIEDYDIAVKEKTCRVCINLKQLVNECKDSESENVSKQTGINASLKIDGGKMNKMNSDDLTRFLEETDFDGLLQETDMYGKEYIKNPLSLFNDIMSSSDDKESEDNIIDCY